MTSKSYIYWEWECNKLLESQIEISMVEPGVSGLVELPYFRSQVKVMVTIRCSVLGKSYLGIGTVSVTEDNRRCEKHLYVIYYIFLDVHGRS